MARQINLVGLNRPRGGRYGDCKRGVGACGQIGVTGRSQIGVRSTFVLPIGCAPDWWRSLLSNGGPTQSPFLIQALSAELPALQGEHRQGATSQ
jgi:hypothetical protein